VTTVAADGTDIGTVAGISSNVTTVAGISSDVTTVAGISGDVSSVAAQVIGYNFSTTTTMADPGSGNVRFNNATVASVTAIAIDDLDANGVDQSAYIALFDDSTNTVKGTLVFRTGGGDVATFNITGLTDNTGWFQIAVTHVASSGTFSNAEDTFIGFTRAGDKGADGVGSGDVSGPGASVTDNAAVRWDTTSGQLVQNSTVTISDAGAVAAGSLTLTTDLAVADGGTGASDAATARSNLGAAASGSNSDITALTGLTTDLSVAQGGTGAGTFTANGVLYGNGTSALGVTATGTSGQVLTSNGSGSAPTFQDVGGGKVLQVVQASTSTQATSTSSSYADTNLSASITPSATSSKILVLAAQQITSAGGRAVAAVNIVRGSTQVIEFNQISNVENQSGTHYLPYLDSPSTTASTTYKTQFKRIDQSGTVQAQRNDASGNATSVITLIEIGA